jgi:hypothetical protein
VLTQQAKQTGKRVVVIGITKDVDERLISLASEFYQISVGRINKITNTLVKRDARDTVIIGKVPKNTLLKPMLLDTGAIKILNRLKDKGDHSIFKAISEQLESSGINLLDQRLYLKELLPKKGVITKQKPSKAQWQDIEYAMSLAREVSALGIGQTVVVKDQMPLAVEAVEGTDETIRRGGMLCRGGAVVAKAAKPDQDFRFDVPTIGPDTMDVLAESKAAVLAIESGKAFILSLNETVQKANSAKLCLVVV